MKYCIVFKHIPPSLSTTPIAHIPDDSIMTDLPFALSYHEMQTLVANRFNGISPSDIKIQNVYLDPIYQNDSI